MEKDQFYREFRLERQDPGHSLPPTDGRQRARLFLGRWDAQRAWGRAGLPGCPQSEWFATADETEQTLRQELREDLCCGHVLPPQTGGGR